jgi:hypothetical protein
MHPEAVAFKSTRPPGSGDPAQGERGHRDSGFAPERFHNSHALSGIEQGGIFLREMPLYGGEFGVQQLWNRCNARPFFVLFMARLDPWPDKKQKIKSSKTKTKRKPL